MISKKDLTYEPLILKNKFLSTVCVYYFCFRYQKIALLHTWNTEGRFHYLVTKEPNLSQEELSNPMFCMLYRFLLKDDMGYDFNTDTAQYFKRYLF